MIGISGHDSSALFIFSADKVLNVCVCEGTKDVTVTAVKRLRIDISLSILDVFLSRFLTSTCMILGVPYTDKLESLPACLRFVEKERLVLRFLRHRMSSVAISFFVASVTTLSLSGKESGGKTIYYVRTYPLGGCGGWALLSLN